MRFPTFAINVWITVMASANWVSKFNDVEEVPDSWDMLEKVGEVCYGTAPQPLILSL